MNIIVKTKLKEMVNAEGYNLASDVYERVEDKVRQLVLEACERANANNRRTVQSKDF